MSRPTDNRDPAGGKYPVSCTITLMVSYPTKQALVKYSHRQYKQISTFIKDAVWKTIENDPEWLALLAEEIEAYKNMPKVVVMKEE